MSLVARIASLTQRDAITSVGFALTGVWLFLLLLFWLLSPGGAAGIARLVSVVGALLPVALIWLGVSFARTIALLRAEADDLRATLNRLRPPPVDEAVGPVTPARPAAAGAGVRPAAKPRAQPDQRQATMPLDDARSVPVAPETLLLALNFPDGPDDTDAVNAMRIALKNHDTSRVLRAAHDLVTLLAGRDVFMDNLDASPVTPTVWRRLADGQRGAALAPFGAVHDERALTIASDMLRQDEIFRDTAHHFLRHFDAMITRLVPELDDAQLTYLSQTRSALGFMLLGRATGMFG
ncbi:hypothetical protein [Paracoccus sp. (in: a-proteobacteria)]|uniref:hypothetical protein n=1 Tax=Paracoccus sp. TaxID=267 RepID=UPI0026DEB52C|nr:hypothetical protein [Paracoccus sp. (in: a-proteobacteria)]MDO5647689.1 hypothetical protein [Paracoccus sp. (in: a-proteobacteria)]